MTYLSWSEGFKSGGFNQRYNAAPPGNAPISFGDETAESFELGLKLDPSDTLRINLAVFSTDYDDIQMTYRLGVVPLLFNAGVATIDGGEIELEYLPTEDFRLDMSAGLSRYQVRQHHAAAAVWSRDPDGDRDAVQPAAVHAGMAGTSRNVVHLPSGLELVADSARRRESTPTSSSSTPATRRRSRRTKRSPCSTPR